MRDAAFFAAFAIYAWAGIDTRLIYHWLGPVFTTMPGPKAHPNRPQKALRLSHRDFTQGGWGTVPIFPITGLIYPENPQIRLGQADGTDPWRRRTKALFGNNRSNRSLTVAAPMRLQSRDRKGAVAGN